MQYAKRLVILEFAPREGGISTGFSTDHVENSKGPVSANPGGRRSLDELTLWRSAALEKMVTRIPKIAASSYLNTAPLCYSFVGGSQRGSSEFFSDTSPAVCAELLTRKECDAAMIPVIEYQRMSGIRISPGTCVASTNKVRSVLLVSKKPIEGIKSVALDTTSRTSAVLVKILLEKFHGLEPAYRAAAPQLGEMLESSDAALIIGDPAMVIDSSGLNVYDLAEEWRANTGLPFVFAFWAVRLESEGFFHGSQKQIDFNAALEEGLANVDAIAADYSRALSLSVSDLIQYLTVNISFRLDDAAIRGLEHYYALAHECGLIPESRPIQFCAE